MGSRAATVAPFRGAASLAALAAILVLAVGQGRTAPLETPAIVSEMCDDEHQAVRNYRSFAAKALEEGHPAVAHFFEALASSETVHARNFMEQLRRLQLAPEVKLVEPTVESSRKNLRRALEVELREIDTTYPDHIARLRRENQEEAVRAAIWAWESEKQHRDLITQLEKGTGLLFGVLESTLEKRDIHYVICQVCGSTYVQLPEGACPICQSDVANYREIPPPVSTQRQSAGTK